LFDSRIADFRRSQNREGFLRSRAVKAGKARRRAASILPLLGFLLFASCRNQGTQGNAEAPPAEIVVSAAASLKDAFEALARRFEPGSGVKVVFNFASSGVLQRQIEFGAPADVFASAGEREMDELQRQGLIDARSRADFAGNTLVLIAPATAGQPATTFADLARPQFKRIAIGNPQTVPAGHYAEQTLERNRLWDKVHGRLILAETVRQVLEYVARGEVDAGLVYSTDVGVAHGRVKVVAPAPEGTYGPIRYPIAIVKSSRHFDAAQKFLEFVLGTDGQGVLQKYGFETVK
jgi:molybdate transport system substrate-binding protein